jgi:hypothetical protein
MRCVQRSRTPCATRAERVLDAWDAGLRSSRCLSVEDGYESPGADLRHTGGMAKEFPDHCSHEELGLEWSASE